MAGNYVNVNPAALAALLKSENGPVMRDMLVRGERVKRTAIGALKPGFPRDFLAPTIVKRVVPGSDGPTVVVGSDKTRTQPHRIDGNPVLVFDWPKAGGTVYLRHVNHPGSDMAPYLRRVLIEALKAAVIGGA